MAAACKNRNIYLVALSFLCLKEYRNPQKVPHQTSRMTLHTAAHFPVQQLQNNTDENSQKQKNSLSKMGATGQVSTKTLTVLNGRHDCFKNPLHCSYKCAQPPSRV